MLNVPDVQNVRSKTKMSFKADKSIEMPKFDGKKEHFQDWWVKFRSFAIAKGVYKALVDGNDLPTSDDVELEESVPAQKLQIAARTRNNMAMAYLLNSFKNDRLTNMALSTMTDEWPGGLAYEVVAKLKRTYQPKDTMSEVEMQRALMKVSMKKNDDPSVLFQQISSISLSYNSETRRVPES